MGKRFNKCYTIGLTVLIILCIFDMYFIGFIVGMLSIIIGLCIDDSMKMGTTFLRVEEDKNENNDDDFEEYKFWKRHNK